MVRRVGAVGTLLCSAVLVVAVGCSAPAGRSDPLDARSSGTASSTSAPTAAVTSGSAPPSPSTAQQPSSVAPSSGPASPDTASSGETPVATPCERYTAELSVEQQVGQLFMMGIASDDLGSRDAEALAELQVGSVILLQNRTAGRSAIQRLTQEVRAAADLPGGLDVMLAVDQEGGKVQRLRGSGFDSIPAAREQSDLTDAELTREAAGWAEQLKAAGIDANLAPVADVVPADLGTANRPIGLLRRGYGSDPDVVAAKVSAFVRGMSGAGVATAVKHYPGLGRVRGNTDYEQDVVDRVTTRRGGDLRGFSAAVAAGADMVMVSSASYARIDPDRRAAFSSVVLEQMARGDLGFEGVVISDDLAARAFDDLEPGERALRFLGAGGDLVIVGNPELAPAMVDAVRSRAGTDRAFAERVRTSAARVVSMKARRGLADCGR